MGISREKVRDGYLKDLPEPVQKKVFEINKLIVNTVNELLDDKHYQDIKSSRWAMSCIDEFCQKPAGKSECGSVRVYQKGKKYRCMVQITGHFTNHQYGWIEELLHEIIAHTFQNIRPTIRKKYDITIENEGARGAVHEGFDIILPSKESQQIWESLDDRKTKSITESGLTESSDNTPAYNVDMSESQAIRTLETLCRSMMNSSNKKGINQYNANIFANIITKNLLQKWAKGFNKLSITVKPQQKNALEFVIPTMSQDFVARFIDGRELISGLLHREPEIRINISSRIFDTMKDASDGWKFFKAAIQYYDTGLEKASIDLFAEVRKLDHNMRHLISTTKLSGIITCPMKLLFVFDDIDMHSKDPFKIDQEDIKAVCRFIKGITSNYASPENEQKEIIDAVESLVKSLQESCEMDDDIRSMTFLSEAVAQLYKGSFNDEIIKSDERFISEQVDYESMRKPRDPNVRYLQEKFGVKKLKKLPVDLVAYITIETESIRDANDKMMIASYCLGKIEIVEWYIELIDVGSKKYVVPHTKPYLDSVRTQLLACYKKIMETPIPKAPGNRPIIDIQYPKGYEG